jgi:hypothetical protein
MTKRKRATGQTMIYITLHNKIPNGLKTVIVTSKHFNDDIIPVLSKHSNQYILPPSCPQGLWLGVMVSNATFNNQRGNQEPKIEEGQTIQ